MSNFDQFFKDKFQDREFEFKEDYWKQAQELIDDDQQDRRKGLWFRMFGWSILLLTLVVAGGVYFLGGDTDPISEKKEAAGIEKEITSINDKTTNTRELTNEDKALTNEEIKQKEQQRNEVNKTNEVEQNLTTNSSKKPIKTSKVSSSQSSSEGVKSSTASKAKNDFSTASQITKSATTFLSNNVVKPISEPGNLQNDNLSNPKKASTTQLVDIPVTTTTSAKENTKTVSPSNSEDLQNADLVDGLNSLPIDLLEIPEKEHSFRNEECFPQIKKWHFGIHALSHFYPAQSGESLWIGGAAGPTVRYRVNKKIGVQADLSYSIRRGNFGEVNTASQKEYSFGLEEKEYSLSPSSMHFLELPIYLQWTNGRQIVEGGIGFKYLLGVRGTLTERSSLFPWERKNNTSDPTSRWEESKVATGILEIDKFNSFIPALLLGYRYKVTNSITANFQVKYNLLPLVVQNEAEVLQESGPLRFSLGLTCFPFGKSRNK